MKRLPIVCLLILILNTNLVYAANVTFPNKEESIIEELFSIHGYQSVEDAVKECEYNFSRELKLPIKLPPLAFRYHFAKFYSDSVMKRLDIEYINGIPVRTFYKISVRPIEQKLQLPKRLIIRPYRLKDGTEAVYHNFFNSKGLLFEKGGWQYQFSVNSLNEDRVSVEILLDIADSIKLTYPQKEKISSPVQAQRDSAFDVVKLYIEYRNQHNRNAIPDLWVEVEEMRSFAQSKECQETKMGFCDIEKAKLVGWKELPYEYGLNFLPTRYIEKFKTLKVFYVAVDYKVHRQTKHHINGVNYFLVAVIKQNDEWKIAVTPIVPVKSIIADGFGFGIDDEKTYDERRLQFVN